MWILFIASALAGTPLTIDWAAEPIVREAPSCDGDLECSQALAAQKSSVRSEANDQARSACTTLGETMGAARASFGAFAVTEMNPVLVGGDITWYVTGRLSCTMYQD